MLKPEEISPFLIIMLFSLFMAHLLYDLFFSKPLEKDK